MDVLKTLNNRYQLLSVIKQGGFGIIYKGHDSVLGKDIAVKEIKPELLGEAWYIDQFQNEARHVAKMNHQNIVHIFDLVQTETRQFYIVMEYIDGVDLNRLMQECLKRGERLPQNLGVYIVAEVCKALDYAHNCTSYDSREPLNLVHQDISPSNIMISRKGLIKLIDFGIAGVQRRTIARENALTRPGKIQYMSPEHVCIDSQLDKRSDIFSLGLVLYEVLEGKRFFLTEDSQKILEILRNGKLKFKDMKHTPKPLQEVLNKSLEHSPEKRYQNAIQFYIDLVTYLVLNSDSTVLDGEIANLIVRMTGQPAAEPSRFSELTESDAIFQELLEDIDESSLQKFESTEMFDDEAPKSAPAAQKPLPMPAAPGLEYTEPFTEVRDEIKTVIDMVRLSTRGHKKLFLKAGAGALGAAALFLLLDILFRWTGFGRQVYDALFPPAIRIASVPAGAKVYLNNEVLSGVTPLSIDEIQPGVYELKLAAAGYKPIIKSIYVPSKGSAEIKGERALENRGSQPYLFRFKTTLEIDSTPPDAEVYIDSVKYGQNTPCSVTLEVGETCQLELRKAGFANLNGFRLDTENQVEEIEDRRLWQFETVRDPAMTYKVRGLFGKFFTFNSNPPEAFIYLNDNPNPIGKTGEQNKVFLTAVAHKITFRKEGYNSQTINLVVNEATPPQHFAALTRPVKFVAYDATNGKNHDLNAVINKIVRSGKNVIRRKITPTQIDLPPVEHVAFLSKKGYRDAQIKIAPNDRLVTVTLEPLEAQVTVVIVDTKNQAPLGNVEIRYKSLDKASSPEILFNITDTEGTCSGNLSPGLYLFRTSKSGYRYQEKSVMIQASGLNMVELNLSKL